MSANILKNAHYKTIREEKFNLAILPWGATEAHNYHLPYGTDVFETDAIAEEANRMANEKGARSVLLPTIPFGVNTGQKEVPLCINMNPSTQMAVIRDVMVSLQHSDIHRLLILNGHGGNDFRQILRELGGEFPEMMLATCNWFQAFERGEIFEEEGDHADEMETSLMMYLHSSLILPLDEAGPGKARKFSIPELNESWAWMERKWSEISSDTGVGDPSKASLLKGKKCFEAICTKISGLIVNLSRTEEGEWYG